MEERFGCVRSFTVRGKGRDVAFHLPADDIRDAVLLQLGEECAADRVLFEPLLKREKDLPARCADLHGQTEGVRGMGPELAHIISDVSVPPFSGITDQIGNQAFSAVKHGGEGFFLFFDRRSGSSSGADSLCTGGDGGHHVRVRDRGLPVYGF